MGTTRGNRIVALSRVVSPVCGHRTDILIVGDLVQQLRQHGRVTHIVGRDFDGSNFQRFLVDTYVYLAPYAPYAPVGAAMLAGIPLSFTF
jgi:hypothetical protein